MEQAKTISNEDKADLAIELKSGHRHGSARKSLAMILSIT